VGLESSEASDVRVAVCGGLATESMIGSARVRIERGCEVCWSMREVKVEAYGGCAIMDIVLRTMGVLLKCSLTTVFV